MSKIKVETITPIHIGSGELLQYNTDFVVSGQGEDSFIHVIDDAKILQLIGEENIDYWLASIANKESTLKLVKRFAPDAKSSDYSRRQITNYAASIHTNATMKETIHNGMGLPYIPGSSIKGAIRTAVVAALTEKQNSTTLSNDIIEKRFDGTPRTDRYGNKSLTAKTVEGKLFGKDPNNDIFRFVRVGDAYFRKNSLIATRMINLNMRDQDDNLIDRESPQLIEAISSSEEAEFQLKIDDKYHNYAKQYREVWTRQRLEPLSTLPPELNSLPDLFMLINQHTKQLVEYELEYWKEVDKSGADYYIESMKDILNTINSCEQGKSCVLRIGHGSGWRFITGAWTERLDNFYPDIPDASRPHNRKRYDHYDFPKSRRMDEESYVLGFVKLTINE